jgi:hypothetical protein
MLSRPIRVSLLLLGVSFHRVCYGANIARDPSSPRLQSSSDIRGAVEALLDDFLKQLSVSYLLSRGNFLVFKFVTDHSSWFRLERSPPT